MSDLFELTVEWPSTTAQTVIVTGDFDKWSKSLQLTRSGSDNFTATIKVPYGCPTRYKFVVDGEWKVKPGQPTELSPEGYLNNIYYVPVKTPPVAKPTANGNVENGNGTAGQSLGVTDWKDTVFASAGTTSALEYIASGIGETMRSVVGVDPINSNQIAIPTPITPTPSGGLPSPLNATAGDGNTANSEAAARSNDTDPASSSGSSVPVAPIIPIKIVPVYAKENCTIDPTKVVSNEEGIGSFVGLHPKPKEETRDDKETAASPPGIPVVVTPPAEESAQAPKEKPATEAATGSKEIEPTSTPEPTPAVPVGPSTEEKASALPASEESPKGGEAPTTPGAKATAATETTTTGHTQDPSSTSTKVASSSRPATPTTAPVAPESPKSTRTSTIRKSKMFASLGKRSPSRASTEGDANEFGAKDGVSTTGKKKKRSSSIFEKLKHIFHHDHHEKENKGEKTAQ